VWRAPGPRLEGRIVVLEPLAASHEDALWEAARDADIWTWMPSRAGDSRDAYAVWFEGAMAAAASGSEVPFATLERATGRPIGSTRYLSLAPEHRRLEIGHTWLAPSTWRSGANAEAKLLQLTHAFERMGCRRVEFKTDALNVRARRALEAIPAEFEGVFRKHMLVRGGESRDSAWYSVIDDDWPRVATTLQESLSRR
jgi:N-acetyltransferase